MPTAISADQRLIREASAHKVYLKENWTGGWEEQPWLYCTWCTFAAAPSVSAAAFEWRYGIGLRQGEMEFCHEAHANWLGKWVKVEIEQPPDADGNPQDPIVWRGRFEEDARRPEGAFVGVKQARQESGDQALLAYGLEAVLDRHKITSSFYTLVGSGGALWDLRVRRGLTFNLPNQGANAGNRMPYTSNRGTYTFTFSVAAGGFCDYWSTRDILQYLAAYHPPDESEVIQGACAIELVIDQDALDAGIVPDWDRPIVASHGRTLKSILDELLDRRRLLSYAVEVDDEDPLNEKLVIRPFTFLDEEVELPSGQVLPANEDQISLDLDAVVDLEPAIVRRSTSQTYDQVVAVGDRVLCVGSFSYEDATLEAGWSAALQTQYEAGGAAGYTANDTKHSKQAKDADARKAEKCFRVFSYFDLVAGWDGQVGNGEAADKHDLFPWAELPELDKAEDEVWYRPEMRFERQLPLKTDHDYSGDAIADKSITDGTPTGRHWEYRRPYVVIWCPDLSEAGYPHWCEIERLAGPSKIELMGHGAGRPTAGRVRCQDEFPGIVVRVSGGQQHGIAYGQFNPLAHDEHFGQFSYTEMIATLAARADCYVQRTWPDPMGSAPEMMRRLWIDASRRCKLEYVAPGTVVDVDDDGTLKRTNAGGFIRDDREDLADLARLAYKWYGVERQSLELVYRQATGVFSIGHLVATIGADQTEEEVRTAITEIRIDLARESTQTHRTTVRTQWAELDVLRLVPAGS